jgi:hypothetical protein
LADILELLRVEQCDCQVGQQKDREDQRDYGNNVNVHGGLPQLLAGLDVKKRQDEEDSGEGEHDYILHIGSRSSGRFGVGWAFRSRPTGTILPQAKFKYRLDFLNKA